MTFALLSATGMLGTGFLESSMRTGLDRGARAIGCDAGSSDSGPYFLGTGSLSRSWAALKRDIDVMLRCGTEAGVPVAIGSDDPPMFATTLNGEYEVAAELLGLDEAGVADLARGAVRASFAPAAVRERVLGEIEAYVAAR